MSLAGCSELLLHTQVDFDSPASEPTPSARRENRRLLDLVHPEYAAPEGAAPLLATRWDCELDVVKLGERERRGHHAAHCAQNITTISRLERGLGHDAELTRRYHTWITEQETA